MLAVVRERARAAGHTNIATHLTAPGEVPLRTGGLDGALLTLAGLSAAHMAGDAFASSSMKNGFRSGVEQTIAGTRPPDGARDRSGRACRADRA